ncbi:unnamed protein product [Rotaria magnacalcarata]|uniref:Uncharacterized protein n=1 Tax=Rotaria magnacalcarata TaxID=392030 RepID=A0A820H8R7_9BILA|nr:unnamed protein product [Rotaria magnacalcarata]
MPTNILGEPEANLLNKISIKFTTNLLQTEDPLDIFNYYIDDEELETLKDELLFRIKKKFMLKPGEKKLHQQQSFNTNSSSIYSLVPAAQVTTQASSVSHKLSLAKHRAHLLKLIDKWCSDNKENFALEHFDLEENVDFVLNIDFDENADVKATIKCKCNRLISLVARELTSSQQQLQPSTPITLTPSYRPHASLVEITSGSPTNTQTTAQVHCSALSKQAAYNGGKRRLTSQSQQHRSTKRSRI